MRELYARTSASELLDLRAYFRVEPRGELREDARLALLRIHWAGKDAKVSDLLPHFRHPGDDDEEAAFEHDVALVRTWAEGMRAQLAREEGRDA